ncbi:MAG: hypothetical protein GVY30_12160 [Chloroflexi bacterium]|jgi:4-amino-4-deoxy-L-arabinose transferase-like glycosyltransferase|nr:hypothetical protein [Chloroflexota bacterium]
MGIESKVENRTLVQSSKRLGRWVAIGLLLVLFGLLIREATFYSMTTDEPSHLAAGYAVLARGREGMWTMPLRGHPLLVDAWAALPLYLVNPDVPLETLNGWGVNRPAYAQSFIESIGPLNQVALASRVPLILLTMLLGATVYRWATDVWGARVGLLALGILLFDPTLLGHGCLATNDVGVTVLGTLALYWIWRWAKRLSWKYAVCGGVFMGLTMLAKGSGVLWAVAGGGAMIARSISMRSAQFRSRLLKQSVVMAGIAFCIVWAMYGFDVGSLPDVPLPVPAPLHWQGLFYHTSDAETHTVYALGNVKQGHWWWYFPLAFVLKNPVPWLIGGMMGVGVWLWRGRHRDLYYVGGFVPLYIGVAITQGPNIGYRHLLPIHPFIYFLISSGGGRLADLLADAPRRGRQTLLLIGGLLGVWYIGGTLRAYPHTISYFNELAGGPENGWRYLASSNTDWCQSWKAIRTWQNETGHAFGFSASTGYLTPSDYGITDYRLLPPSLGAPGKLLRPWLYPAPGKYVIGANTLSGLSVPFIENYSWFRYHVPDTVIGGSHFYYQVPEPTQPTWVAQCSRPVHPLNADAISEGFGAISPRNVIFDCAHTWIYPYGGRTTGWYALHDQTLQSSTIKESLYLADSQIVEDFPGEAIAHSIGAHHLDGVPQSFRQWADRRSPAFALYEWQPEDQILPIPDMQRGVPAKAEAVPLVGSEDALREAPWLFDDTMTLLGVNIGNENENKKEAGSQSAETLGIETWWRMENTAPFTRSFSIMAHLVGEAGESVAVADGLGVSPIALRPGDVIVQYHEFEGSLNKAFWLRTGVYWLDDGKRWPIAGDAPNDAVFVPLRLE